MSESKTPIPQKEDEESISEDTSKSTPSDQDAPPPPGGLAYWQWALGVAVIVLGLDHLTKYLTLEYLASEGERGIVQTVIPGFFNLTYAENRGAAFSFLDGHTEILALFSLVASALIIYWFRSLPAKEFAGRLAIGAILGGAIGNLIDRAFRGFVVDMIDWYVGEHHWPTFNIADSAIVCGVAVLIIQMFRGKI